MIHNFMLDLFGMLALTCALLGAVISVATRKVRDVISASELFTALLLILIFETLAFMCLISMALTRCGIAFVL